MAINRKKLAGRISYFGAQTDNKYETGIKGISSAINNISATTDRSTIPLSCPGIEDEDIPPAFSIFFNDIVAVDTAIGDSSNFSDWNTYFDLPTYGTAFTSVDVIPSNVEWITFTKQNNVAATDIISDGLHITRANNGGWLYNPLEEQSSNQNSPSGSLWSMGFGDLSNITERDYVPLETLWENNFVNLPNAQMIMLDTTTGKYWAVKFNSWANNQAGGGFSYSRYELDLNNLNNIRLNPEVRLYGGSDIVIKESLFDQVDELGTHLVSINDELGSIIEVEYDGFGYDSYEGCQYVTSVNLPALTTAGDYAFRDCGRNAAITFSLPSLVTASDYCFYQCESLTSLSLPSLTTAGNYCFSFCRSLTSVSLPNLTVAGDFCFSYSDLFLTSVSLPSCTNLGSTVGDNSVFNSITGKTIVLTVPSALMTCDAGNPDGDIVYLQNNNTVTVTTV